MTRLVASTSTASLGCTFVDWSINFLSGQSHMFHAASNQWVPVVSDPLTANNAHAHKKNHPSGLAETITVIDQLQNVSADFCTFYPFSQHLDHAARSQNINTDSMTADAWQRIKLAQAQDFGRMFDHMCDQGVKIIYVELNKNCLLYQRQSRAPHRLPFEDRPPDAAMASHEQVQQIFFQQDLDVWQQADLTHTWDIRERLALCMRPFEPINEQINTHIDFTRPHLWIDSQSLWHNGLVVFKDIMHFADIAIDSHRWNAWQPVYAKWQAIQAQALEFVYRLPHIVDAVVNNWYYHIGPLTLIQEAIVQHCLIYQHDLNIKTWNLDRFPVNAQDLHTLIEPNIHPIQKIY